MKNVSGEDNVQKLNSWSDIEWKNVWRVHEHDSAHKWFFSLTVRFLELCEKPDSDFSKHTGSDHYKCCQGELKLWETFVLEFTNEIPDDTIEDDVRNIRGDIVIEKIRFRIL